MTPLLVAAIVIVAAMLLTVVIGLPLLFPRGSLIPDLIGLGFLMVVVLAFVWSTGSWWTLVPALAIIALVAWMDRKPEDGPDPETGTSDRTRARFRLWRAANRLTIVLLALIILAAATGVGASSVMGIAPPLLLVMMVASSAFRFSYNRSIPRKRCAAADPPAPAAAT